jgi:hypothetical protein
MAFRFQESHKNDGFDNNPSTPWLMVPLGGAKEIELTGLKSNLFAFTWKCVPPGAVTVDVSASGGDRLIVKSGPNTGLFRLEAKNAAGKIAVLNVSVKKRHTYNIQAFKLMHTGGHISTRSFGSLELLVREANEVLTPQTNQYFALTPGLLPLQMSEDFGTVIRNDEHTLVSIAANQACWDRNVIPLVLVNELSLPGPGGDTEGATYIDSIVIEDNVTKHVYVLAHELGHFFGLGHHSKSAGLMKKFSPRGSKVYMAESNTMNQTGLF